MTSTEARAARLVRWYPRVWRNRYGAEFADLLCAEIGEQPKDWRRDLDVRRHGLQARVAAAGLGSGPVRDPDSIRLLDLVAVLTFAAAVLSLWSQVVDVTSYRSLPDPSAAAGSLAVTPLLTALVLAPIGFAAVIRLTRNTFRSIRRTGLRRLTGSMLMVGIGVQIFVAGFVLAWSDRASTAIPQSGPRVLSMSISTYWIHPADLLKVGAPDLIWMILSPLAVALVLIGAFRLAREVNPTRSRPSMTRLVGRFVVAVPTFVVSAWWAITSQNSQASEWRAGTLDLALIFAMTVALLVLATTCRTTRRTA